MIMKPFVHLALPAFTTLILTSCSMTWIQQPPVDAGDGSQIVTTAYHKQYRRDSLRIDRIARDGSRSTYTIEKLPENFDDYSLQGTTGKSVTIRLLDAGKKVIQDVDIPYSSFTPKG